MSWKEVFMSHTFEDFTPILRFIAMSDIHYRDEHTDVRDRFELGLTKAYEYAESTDYKNIDALCIVGDFANRGSLIEMEAFKESVRRFKHPKTELIISIATHEMKDKTIEATEDMLRNIFDLEPDVHRTIKGFHFISLSTTESETSKRCGFDEKKRRWFAEQMEIASTDTPKYPIFMFQHPHPKDTVYGAIKWGNGDLYPIQEKYPALVTFSGHSHAPINDPRSIHQRDFTSLGCGSLAYFELDEFDKVYGTVPPRAKICAQYLIVEADAQGRVRVLPYDIITEQFFPDIHYIEKPWDKSTFVYNDSRPGSGSLPFFPEGSKLGVENILNNGLTLIIPQAQIDAFRVNSYYIHIYDKATHEKVKTLSIWSEYYFYDMPPTLFLEIDELESGKTFDIEVFACNFWNKLSKDCLQTTVTTKA